MVRFPNLSAYMTSQSALLSPSLFQNSSLSQRSTPLPESLIGLPEAIIAAAGAKIDLERALARLSDAERLCVTLNHGEGLSHSEIVDMTGLPLGTVKSHVLRGTEKLRRMLEAA